MDLLYPAVHLLWRQQLLQAPVLFLWNKKMLGLHLGATCTRAQYHGWLVHRHRAQLSNVLSPL